MQLSLHNVIDIDNYDRTRAEILECLSVHNDMLLDLSAVTFIDSAGLSCLVEAHQRAQAENKTFILLNPSEAVVKILRFSALDSVFTIEHKDVSTGQQVEDDSTVQTIVEDKIESAGQWQGDDSLNLETANVETMTAQTSELTLDDLDLGSLDDLPELEDLGAVLEPLSSPKVTADVETVMAPEPVTEPKVSAPIEPLETAPMNEPEPVIYSVSPEQNDDIENLFPVTDTTVHATEKADKNNLNKHSAPEVKLEQGKIIDYDDDPLNRI